MQATNAERELIRLIRETQFGSIANIKLVGGQPETVENTDVIIEYKLSGIEPKREVLSERDYLSRPQVRAMFERFRIIHTGTVECLDVRDGLPFKMSVRRNALV